MRSASWLYVGSYYGEFLFHRMARSLEMSRTWMLRSRSMQFANAHRAVNPGNDRVFARMIRVLFARLACLIRVSLAVYLTFARVGPRVCMMFEESVSDQGGSSETPRLEFIHACA